jgi:hypothetical protein
MKRLVCLLMSSVLLVQLAGCGGEGEPQIGAKGEPIKSPEVKEAKEAVSKKRPNSEAY